MCNTGGRFPVLSDEGVLRQINRQRSRCVPGKAVRNTDDRQIIQLYLARDERAIRETEEKYGSLCMGLALRILGSREDAEECVSDVYLRLWQSGSAPDSLQAYLSAAVRHAALDRLSMRNAAKRGGGILPEPAEELAQTLAAPDDVQRQVEDSIMTEALNRFLAKLPAKQRRVFLQRYWYMLSAREIALQMGMNENTVRSLLLRTRKQLRKFLEKEDLL